MQRHLFFFGLLMIFTQACTKKIGNVFIAQPTWKMKTPRLAQTVIAEGSNTITTTYGYGTDDKLTVFRQARTTSGEPSQQGFRIYRNAAGLIQKVRLRFGNADSITLDITSAGTVYLGADLIFPSGANWRLTFTCDAQGRIVNVWQHNNANASGAGDDYQSFAYQNGNMVYTGWYQNSADTGFLYGAWRYEYDTKKSPFIYGNEWLLLSRVFHDFWYLGSPRNVSRIEKIDGQRSDVTAYTYVYNRQGFPLGFTASSSDSAKLATTGTYMYE